jgi:hypothetical protein
MVFSVGRDHGDDAEVPVAVGTDNAAVHITVRTKAENLHQAIRHISKM